MPGSGDDPDLAIDLDLLARGWGAREMKASGGCGILMLATIEDID
tara:strand:+ start:132 stop:266 length:135 start_codon:yes stop_codon:yes gene_type:complete